MDENPGRPSGELRGAGRAAFRLGDGSGQPGAKARAAGILAGSTRVGTSVTAAYPQRGRTGGARAEPPSSATVRPRLFQVFSSLG